MVNTALNPIKFSSLSSNSQSGAILKGRSSESFWAAIDAADRLTNDKYLEVSADINVDANVAVGNNMQENLQILKNVAENAKNQVTEELIEQTCMDALDRGNGNSFRVSERSANGGKITAEKKLSTNSLTITFSLKDKVPCTKSVDGKNKVYFEDVVLKESVNIEVPEEQFRKAVTNYLSAGGYLARAKNIPLGSSEVLDEKYEGILRVPLLIASKDNKGNLIFTFRKDSAKFTIKYTHEQLKAMGMATEDKKDSKDNKAAGTAGQNTATASVSGNVANPFAAAGKGLISFS